MKNQYWEETTYRKVLTKTPPANLRLASAPRVWLPGSVDRVSSAVVGIIDLMKKILLRHFAYQTEDLEQGYVQDTISLGSK